MFYKILIFYFDKLYNMRVNKNTINIVLDKPVHKAQSHWTEFGYLIPTLVLDHIRGLPTNVTSLVQPNCPVSSILAGLLLGDGCIQHGVTRNGSFIMKLAANERSLAFMAITAMFLEQIGLGYGYIQLYQRSNGNWALVCISKVSVVWNEARLFWYPNNIKTIPQSIPFMLSHLGIALWLSGDGSRAGGSTSSGTLFCTHSFDHDGLLLLCNAVNNLYGLKLFLTPNKILKSGRQSYLISGRVQDSRKMREIFSPYLHQLWHYKFASP